MTNVRPIRRPDAVDTAKQFAAELDTPGRRPAPRWTAKCFGRSRFRRARWMDAAAVALLMALMACLGVVVFASTAKADGYMSDDEQLFADTYYTAVCDTLDDYRSIAGVVGVVQGVSEQGFHMTDSVDIVNYSVATYCPRHWWLLVATGQAARGGA